MAGPAVTAPDLKMDDSSVTGSPVIRRRISAPMTAAGWNTPVW